LPPSSAHHDNIVSHQKNLINASDTRSRNLYRKLVQVVLYKKLACMFVGQSFTSFFLHKFPTHNYTNSISGQKPSGTWLKWCYVTGQPVVIDFVVISFQLFLW